MTATGTLIAACLLVCPAAAFAQASQGFSLGQSSAPATLGQQQFQQQPAPQRQPTQQQAQQRKQTQQRAANPRIAEIAGRYAVLREEGKDTLCMVTLSETARSGGYYRAQLAPACRDNGIVIFDPVAWTIDRQGHISLQARKGHKMVLERDANGVWQRMGDPKARPLGLRRI